MGLDFSGAHDAGARIWVADCEWGNDCLSVINCRPAFALPGGDRARAAALSALIRHIGHSAPGTLVGCDFPFALPGKLMGQQHWPDFISEFTATYPNAEIFRATCLKTSGGRELKRRCDNDAKTPFSAYNLRLYRQTYHGIASVLAPLLAAGKISVPPMTGPANRARPILIEACPASLLKRESLYRSYKGRSESHRQARETILRELTRPGALAPIASDLRGVLLDDHGGDALDSVLAALAAARAQDDPRLQAPTHDDELREGWVAV